MFHSGNRTQLKIDFVQVGQAEPLLDEMERGVLAEEEDGEGFRPKMLLEGTTVKVAQES